MLKARSGSIINISSVVGVSGNAGQGNYSASKAGVINLSKVLCNEWIEHGINVNTIAPSGVKTDFNRQYLEENPEVEKRLISEIPAGRLGRPEDHIGPVVFLASEASDFICGQLIYVDGGRMVM